MKRVRKYLLLLCLSYVAALFGTGLAASGDDAESDANRSPDVGYVGPCSPTGFVNLTETTIGRIKISSGKMTLPGCDSLDRVGLVLFHNGFAGREEFYRKYANSLASWGWAVLQYDLNCFQFPTGGPCPQLQDIKDEARALPGVLAWAQRQTDAADPAAAARIDWTNIVVGGHSRGAHVSAESAALFPAQPPAPSQECPTAADTGEGAPADQEAGAAAETGPADAGRCAADPTPLRVQAVLLVDPVAKSPTKTPLVSDSQPYFAVVGKGSRWCAPKRLGADDFIPRPDPPLTQAVHVPQAGHAQFWHAPPRWQTFYDWTCGTGSETDATIRAWTTRLLSAWLLQNLPLAIDDVAREQAVAANKRWVQERERAGDFQEWRRS